MKQYRVLYWDGRKSIPMIKSIAQDYARMFGGVVERVPGAADDRQTLGKLIKQALFWKWNSRGIK
jgi:hypothetical protein